MNRKLSAWQGRYLAALRKHLKQSLPSGLEATRGLGRQASVLGLRTLDVARIHERALARLGASGSNAGLVDRAAVFFQETVTPIEATHPAALEAGACEHRLNQRLGQRTAELTVSNRSLKQGIVERKTAEAALQKSSQHYQTLLEQSRSLQNHLRRLTHRILAAQEDKRNEVGHALQDEIGQTLLGINVRLLTIKKAASRDLRSLQKEIALTQRLVHKSERTMERFTREYGKQRKP